MTRSIALAPLAAAALALALAACGGGDDTNPRPDTNFTTGSVTSASSTVTTGTGGQQNCDGPNGCYNCAPTTNDQFLNACTDATCVPFDNERRLPRYNGGDLPPIP